MTQFGTETIDRIKVREILLGNRFAPKKKDIDTPQMLLDAGIPAESLRLVGLPATEAMQIKQASASESTGTLRSGMYICACVRWRADEEPVLNMTDVQALITQDIDLVNELALVVNPFLGIGLKAVTDAKNGSGVQTGAADGPKTDGGSESPSTGDSTPSENASTESNTATS